MTETRPPAWRDGEVAALRAGVSVVEPFEVHELGPLGGRRLVQLGGGPALQLLDLLRMHPALTGSAVDADPVAVDIGRELAAVVGVSAPAELVAGRVAEAAGLLGPGRFDVAYSGRGAFAGLPHLDEWAETAARLLTAGGVAYVVEVHPAALTLAPSGPAVVGDYFGWNPVSDTIAPPAPPGTALGPWPHPLSDVIRALHGAGFTLDFLHEWDSSPVPLYPWLVEAQPRRWTFPGPGRLPLGYSLRAERR